MNKEPDKPTEELTEKELDGPLFSRRTPRNDIASTADEFGQPAPADEPQIMSV